LPKADRQSSPDAGSGQWRDILLDMLKVALGVDLRFSDTSTQSLQQPSLVELVVRHLIPMVEQLVHEGLSRGYREEEANGTTFRGRLMFAEQVRQNHSRADRCFARYHVYDRDVPINRLVRAALHVAVQSPISAPLRSRVIAALPGFESIRGIRPAAKDFDRLVLNRSTERYRSALTLARMLVEGLAPAMQAGKVPVFSLLFDMNALWERYIGVLFRRAGLPKLRVALQNRRPFWRAGSQVRTIRPDIVVADSGGRALAVLDTKWKLAPENGPEDGDLKQMFAYNELFGTTQAFLIYPTARQATSNMSGWFTDRTHRCTSLEFALTHDGKSRTSAVQQQVCELLSRISETLQ
jgi:5-methylcytosine-specific restriction enzyme subunit McrC